MFKNKDYTLIKGLIVASLSLHSLNLIIFLHLINFSFKIVGPYGVVHCN